MSYGPGDNRMTQPDPDALRLRWVEQQSQDDDEPDWRDEWVDTLDHHDR